MGYGGVISKVIDPFGWSDPDAVEPADPNAVGADFTSLLNAYIRSQPDLLKAEQTYKPQYLQSSIANLQTGAGAAQDLFRQGRQANITDLSTLGPGAAAAVRATNPESAALLSALTGQAQAGLAAGTRLSPDETRNVIDPIASRYANAGFAPGAMQGLEEGLNLFEGGQNLQQRRQNFAGQTSDRYNRFGDQAFSLATGGTEAPAFGQVISSGAGASIVNPSSTYDIFNTAYNARSAANIASANNLTASQSY